MRRWWFQVREWVRERFQAPSVLARVFSVFGAGTPLPQPADFYRLADEGYRKNVIIYRCIRELAESAAEPALVARRKGAQGIIGIDRRNALASELVTLLRRPNPNQSAFSFVESLITFQQIAGIWYVEIERDDFGMPKALWPLRPDRLETVPGLGPREVLRYDFVIDGRRRPIAPENMIVDSLLDPLNDFHGLSPIAVAARVADTDNEAMEYLRRFFANSATPAGIVKLKKKVPPATRLEIKEKWEQQLRGPKGWHSIGVLDEDADYQAVGFSLKDLNMTGVFSETEARLCGVFGVPPILVAAKVGLDRSTYANYEEARRSFWVETLRPMYQRFADRLNHALTGDDFPWSGWGNFEIAFDFTNVGPLQEAKEALRKFVHISWTDGLLMLNEARGLLGLAPVASGDVFRATTNDIFLPPEEDRPVLPPGRDAFAPSGNGAE